jgi:hypothetical protein
MTALRRSPLLLAVVLALIPAIALAVLIGPLRHRATSPTSIVTPAPRPTALPLLIARDNTSIGAARAFGPIDVTGYDHHDGVSIARYALAATPGPLPSSLPVWRLRGFVKADVSALEAQLGVAPSTPEFPGDKPDGRIDVGQAQVATGSVSTLLTVATQPSSDTTAIAAVARLLSELGLTPQNADVAVTATEERNTPLWHVSYRRQPIEGVAVGFGLFRQTVAEVDITSFGSVTRVAVDDPALDGGSQYPLRTWQDAWTDVSRGQWFDQCCQVYTGGTAKTAAPFHADTVSLVYEQVGAVAMRLVPMYVFTDSLQHLSLATPALQLADLSEPGGFRLTQPGAA